MLKRGAQGPQGSKEDEGAFGMASTPDDKPHRATAAQLASRKIKNVRSRRAPTPTTGGGASDAASFNPFASAAPAPAPTQTGFTFGQTQSQSFPGTNSGPGQGGIFSSGTNGQTGGQASFNFGSGPTSFGSAPSSNPFSVDTSFGGTTQSSTNGFSFGGFNAGNQATPSFGGFGAQQNTSTPAKPVLFGQSTTHMTSPADENMQTSPDNKPKGASIFSHKPAAPEKPADKPAETQPFKPLFGSTPAASKPFGTEKPQQTFNNPFANLPGQNASSNLFAPKTATSEKPAEKPAETQPFKPLFLSTPAASKPFGAEKPQQTFNNPFANIPGQAPTSSTNLFAPKITAAEQTPAKPAEAAMPFGTLFGSTSSSQPSGPASNLFAPKPAAEEPKASNPFASIPVPSSSGNLSSPKVTEKTTEAQPFKPLFGTPTTSKAVETGTPAPAFGNLFSPKPVAENAAAKPAADQPFKSMFGTPAVSKASEAGKEQTASPAFGNMFSPKPVVDSTAGNLSEGKPFNSMFGTPTKAEKEQSAASSVFTPKVTSEAQTPIPAKTSQFGSIFGASPASKLGKEKTAQATPSNPFANLPGQNAFSNPFSPKPAEQAAKAQAPSTSLFGASTAIDNNKQNKDIEGNKDNKVAALNSPLTNSFTPGPKVSNGPQTEGATTATPRVSFAHFSHDNKNSSSLPVPSSSTSSLPSSTTSTVPNTFTASDPDSLFPPTDHPVSLDYPESTEDFDSMPLKRLFPEKNRDELRTRASLLRNIGVLTESFKREIVKCDPTKENIDDILILYAELRRELGVPIGSIKPGEPAKRATIHQRATWNEGAAAKDAAVKDAPNGYAPPRNPTPPTFVPPALDGTPSSSSTKPSGGSTTSSKFAQSFSAPTPAPANTSVSTSNAGPSSSAAAPVSVAPVTLAEPSPPTTAPNATPVATPTVETPKLGDAATSTATPAFQIPKFGDAATSNATPAFQIPKFGDAATSNATPAFKIPKFGSGATGTDFAAQFKSVSDKTLAEAKAKRKAEEFDSDEEDEAEWERKDEERQREKRAQLEAAANKRSVYVPGVGFKFADDNTAPQDVEEPATSATPSTPPSLFPPFTAPSTASTTNGTPSSSQYQPRFPRSSPQSSEFSTLVGTATRSPADAALFGTKPGPPPPSLSAGPPSSSVGSSIFSGSVRKPVPASQNIFGKLKPTSPKRKASADESDNDDDSPPKKTKSSHNIFGGPQPTSQNIFGGLKPTSPKRKASVDESDNQDNSLAKKTKPSPPPPSAGASMFGRASTAPSPAPSTNVSSQPAMATPSATSSAPPTQSISTATEDEDGEPGEIFDLTKGNSGEEEETVMFEETTRIFKLTGTWQPKGTGPLRVLKHPVTGRARIVARADPSGNVILNAPLMKQFDYKSNSNRVQLLEPNQTGGFTQCTVRIPAERMQEFLQLVNEIKT
ncbi:hypothetical protein DTO006G1_7902 [Penicillium roqueforti]|nr:hypothetical protein CBS147337_8097 [Penicillium roqueforti]KAI2756538.1 hypothetical protein DTO006G1_7902 [Penicillium roqueforti]KAI3127443.1 hypothetical protein CBS147326_7233 [Penicillium roqueforti]KAI3257321.1 hypothetical protein DTO006G7_2888 [Penicillium roqueforti]